MKNSGSITHLDAYRKGLPGNLLFENSVTPMILVDGERRITVVNKRFTTLFGYSPDEVIGRKTSLLTPTEQHFEEYKSHFEKTRDGRIESSELKYRKKSGELFWVKLSGIPLVVEGSSYILWSFDDITAEVAARHEIRTRYLELDIIFNKVPTGLIYVVDARIERANPSFLRMINDSRENVLGKEVSAVLEDFEQGRESREKKLVKFHNGRNSITVEREIERVSENSYIVLFFNITQHVIEKMALLTLAQTDGLTDILNRSTFMDRSQAMLADPAVGVVTLVILDIDHFKEINDNHGHDIGDEVLRELAGFVKKQIREGEIFGRLGGEEFGISLPCTKEKAAIICKRLLEGIRSLPFSRKRIRVTASAGLTDSRFSNQLETIYREADRLLYQAKRSGRDRLCF